MFLAPEVTPLPFPLCPLAGAGGQARDGRAGRVGAASADRVLPLPSPGCASRPTSPRWRRVAACCSRLRRPLRQQTQPEILGDVGVLIFVDQNEFEARLILPQHFRVLAEQPDVLQQKIAEIGGVEDFQPLLKRLVEFQPLAVGEHAGLARRHLLGRRARDSSSRRSATRARAPASVSRRYSRPRAAASTAAPDRRHREW